MINTLVKKHGDYYLENAEDSDPNIKVPETEPWALSAPIMAAHIPDYTRKYAIRYRDERTKRPLNVKNIRTTTGSAVHGNFVENYEVVHTFGRKQNSKGFVESGGSASLSPFFNGLPATTQEASLIGVEQQELVVMLVSNFNNSNRYPRRC